MTKKEFLKNKKVWVYGFIFLFMFFTMFYADLTVTARFSMVFLDSLFDGNFASFYSNAMCAGIAPEGAVYDIGMYLVFGVWGLPVWVINKVVALDYLSVGSLLWFKLLLVVAAFGTVYYTKKIAEELQLSKNKYCEIGFLVVSVIFVFPFLVVAQYDILPLFCIMKGIYEWLNRKNVCSNLWFAISITMKPFGVFPFILLLLLKEKNVMKLFENLLAGIAPLILCKTLYLINSANVSSNNSFMEENIPALFRSSILSAQGNISLFFTLLFIIYIVAYFYEWDEDTIKNGKIMIWLNYILWSAFCIIGTATPYWIIYYAPFLALVILYNKEKINQVLILELVLNLSLITIKILQFGWVYGGKNTFRYLMMKPLLELKEEVNSVNGVLVYFKISELEDIFQALVLACAVMIGYYSYSAIKGNQEGIKVKIHPMHMWVRIGVLYFWVLINLLCII